MYVCNLCARFLQLESIWNAFEVILLQHFSWIAPGIYPNLLPMCAFGPLSGDDSKCMFGMD